jgi:hypothetical protein
MKVAIVQSNYIPWKGYFDLIRHVDHFVFFDDVQYTRRDWRNRNKIKTAQGLHWLTIPVKVKGEYLQLIRDTEVSDTAWRAAHWATIRNAYAKAPFFKQYQAAVEAMYVGGDDVKLSDINRKFAEKLCGLLGITTPFSWSWEHAQEGGRTEKLAAICAHLGATEYVSGPAAKSYMDEAVFTQKGMAVSYFDYSGYAAYPQMHGEFEHGVSVLDLIFNVGPDAIRYLDRQPALALAGEKE